MSSTLARFIHNEEEGKMVGSEEGRIEHREKLVRNLIATKASDNPTENRTLVKTVP